MEVKINISEKGIEINGCLITLPCGITQISDILGNPKKTSFKKIENDLFDKDELAELNRQAANRACYTWNALGIHCHTDDGVTVNTFSLKMNDSVFYALPDYYATKSFNGAFTINGKAWVKELEKGDIDESSTELILGDYSVYATYSDGKSHLFNKARKYSVVEISLEDDDDLDD